MALSYPFLLVIYLLLLVYTVVRILLETKTTAKALGYLLLVVAFPILGIAIYYWFGLNFRHRASNFRMFSAQLELDRDILAKTDPTLLEPKDLVLPVHLMGLVDFVKTLSNGPLHESFFTLLNNGEEKFPEVLRALHTAKHFIHVEYYAWENDTRGNQIKDVLLLKAKEGVHVRVLYDHYASRKIRSNIVKELKAGGVAVVPRVKVRFVQLANRINHRDHRKIIIVDGMVGFVGGINISDRYDNSISTKLYWRDTHVKIAGSLVNSLQRHFIVSWNASQEEQLSYTPELFPTKFSNEQGVKAFGQVVAGGPIYPTSTIMLTYFKIFTSAREKLYIANPYFIPNDTTLDALKQAAISGVDVRLLLPYKSDSQIVGAASKFYFPELVKAGVKIYLYKKGFIHAKTLVADSYVSVVGTANMDVRSFDLNFEIMSVIYGREFGDQMEKAFMDDLGESVEITNEIVESTGFANRLYYSTARLISSFL